jgi:hypothetical protein
MNTKDEPSKDQPMKPPVQPDIGRSDRRVLPVRVPDDATTVVRKHEVLPKDIARGK